MEIEADNPPIFPLLAGHAGPKMAPEEVEALSPLPEVDHSGLVRMEGETEVAQDGGGPPLGFLGLFPGRAQHHEVVRIADDFSDTMLGPGPVEGVQVDVCLLYTSDAADE